MKKPLIRVTLMFLAPIAARCADSSSPLRSPSPAPSLGPSGDTVELSPFVVNVEKDKDYAATTTLSGTRLATDLCDTAGSFSIMTPELTADSDDFGVFGKPGETRVVRWALQRPRTYTLSLDVKF